MLKRVAMVVIVAAATAAAASAQTSAGASGQASRRRRPRRHPHRLAAQSLGRHRRHAGRRDASGDDHVRGGHGVVVRADRRGAAGEEMVAERLPGELRPRPGLHGHLELAGDVRDRASGIAPRSSAPGRWSAGSTATSGRCSCRGSRAPAASSTSIRSCARGGRTTSWGTLTVGAKINLLSEWRQQPVALARCAAMVKLPTAKDRRRRASAPASRISALDAVAEQGNQPAGRALRLRRVHRARGSGRRGSEQRDPLGRRRRAAVAQEPAADGGTARRALSERHGDADDRRSSGRTGACRRW